MTTITDKINEIQAEINELNNKQLLETIFRSESKTLEFLNLQLTAYNELLSFDYNIKLDDSNYCQDTLILNDVLRVKFNKYRNIEKYNFSVNVDYKNVPSHLKDTKLSPNNISIGKTTKKKLDSWIAYANEVIKEAENYKAEVEANIQESKATINKLINLPNVRVGFYKGDQTSGLIESEECGFKFEIREDGRLHKELSFYSCGKEIEIFERIVLAGL